MRTADLFLGREAYDLAVDALEPDLDVRVVEYERPLSGTKVRFVEYADFGVLTRSVRAELDDLAVRAVMEMAGRVL